MADRYLVGGSEKLTPTRPLNPDRVCTTSHYLWYNSNLDCWIGWGKKFVNGLIRAINYTRTVVLCFLPIRGVTTVSVWIDLQCSESINGPNGGKKRVCGRKPVKVNDFLQIRLISTSPLCWLPSTRSRAITSKEQNSMDLNDPKSWVRHAKRPYWIWGKKNFFLDTPRSIYTSLGTQPKVNVGKLWPVVGAIPHKSV